MPNVHFSFRRGAGDVPEILYGKVEIKPTLAFARGTSLVLPAPTTLELVNGEATANNVYPTPAPVEGQVEWAYRVKAIDTRGQSFEWMVGVPDSTGTVEFTSLPRYFETKPPLFGKGEKGDPGEAATIQIGTTTSGTTPDVTNSGTNQNAVLDFVLPKGDKGDRGDGVPEGGADKQIIQKNGTTTQWVDPEDATPLATPLGSGLLEPLDQRTLLRGAPVGDTPLNSLITPGNWIQYDLSQITLDGGYPIADERCIVRVRGYRDGSPGSVVQEILYVGTGKKFSRYTNTGGAAWYAWREEALASEVGSAIEAIPLADDENKGLLPAGKVSKILETLTAPSGTIDTLVTPNDYSQLVLSQATTSNGWAWNSYAQLLRVRAVNSSGSRVEQTATNLATLEVARRTTSTALDPLPTWSEWKFDVRDSDLKALLAPENYRISLSNYTDFREDSVNGVPRIARAGNTYFLLGAVRVNTANLISTGSYVEILRLPSEAMPMISSYMMFVSGTRADTTYNIRIEPDGRVRVGLSSNSAADALVMFNGISWPGQYRDPKNTYYLHLNKFVRGVEFQETYSVGGNPNISVLAIHGGETEKISSELADKVKTSLNASFFELDTMLDPLRGDSAFNLIHHDSNDYTNVNALSIVRPSKYCISFHGAADDIYGDTGRMSYVGGRDLVLRQKISDALNASGFPARHDSENFPGLAGTSTKNICNQTTQGMGVQIELSVSQRRAFVSGGNLSRANRVNTTPAFTQYTQVIADTVAAHISGL